MKNIAFILSLGWLAYFVSKGNSIKKLMQPNKTEVPKQPNKPTAKVEQTKKHVVVINKNGTTLFAGTGADKLPEYGNGRNPITKVSNHTYLGLLTGREQNEMVEICTKINTANILFWVHKTDVVFLTKRQYEIARADKNILDKKDETKLKLLQNS